jgi:alpha-L-fucosidase 2
VHEPRIFQIEANFGASAAVVEMFLQSYFEVIDLLPALPEKWPQGKVTGLRARGGYTVSIEWKNGFLWKAEIVSLKDRTCSIRDPEGIYEIQDDTGEKIAVTRRDNKLNFDVVGGKTYTVLNRKRNYMIGM